MKKTAAAVFIFSVMCFSSAACSSKKGSYSSAPSYTSSAIRITEPAVTSDTEPELTAPVTVSSEVSDTDDTDSVIDDISDAVQTAVGEAEKIITDIIEDMS